MPTLQRFALTQLLAALAFCSGNVTPGFGQQTTLSCKYADARDCVRTFVRADHFIQALRPPAVAYVWYELTPEGRLVATGRDSSRVALLRHARALGVLRHSGISPAGKLASVRVIWVWIEVTKKQ